MNLAQSGNESATALRGVVTTLRRLYQPQFDVDTAVATLLDALQRNEQQSIPQLAAAGRQSAMSAHPA